MSKRPPRKGKKSTKKNVLLIDSNALFKVGYHGAFKEVNWKGEKIGGIYQFITVLKKLLLENLYHKVYAFWDGELSGKLRYDIYPDYKGNRDKSYSGEPKVKKDKDENPYFIEQKIAVKNYLEELHVRQVEDKVVEGDDLIAYYVLNADDNEFLTIVTNDRDILQLLRENVRVYLCDLKVYITIDNYHEYFKHHYTNIGLIKTIVGDSSDNIKGIKGLQEKGLLKLFPILKERKVTLEEIITLAESIQKDRIENKKKPLMSIENLLNRRTVGIQGGKIFEINDKIIDLNNPIMTESAKENMNDYMTLSINPEGRDIKNVYQYLKRDGVSRLIGTNNLSEYFLPFKKLINREINN